MPVFRKDPCGIACVVFTYVAIFYSDYVVVNWIVLQTMRSSLWGAFHAVVFNTVVFLAVLSHLRAVLSDPGVVPLPTARIDFSDVHSGPQSDEGEKTICGRCEMYRPPRAHHCRVCQRCVRRMDHHCPWINNCVGEWNQKYFLQFLFYIAVLCAYSMLMIALGWLYPCEGCSAVSVMVKQQRLMHSVILSMESILFGMFVAAILCDQLQAIFADETAIEQIQRSGPHRPGRPAMATLREVCGAGHPLVWLLPCAAPPHQHSLSLVV